MAHRKMPHNNRVSSSTALKTNDMWSKTIGFDPYAGNNDSTRDEKVAQEHSASLMLLAKMSNVAGSESRGGCKKCGMLGHLTYQCRNVQLSNQSKPNIESDSDSSSDDDDDDDDDYRNYQTKSSSNNIDTTISSSNIVKTRITDTDIKPSYKRHRSDSTDDSQSSASTSSTDSRHHKRSNNHHKKQFSSSSSKYRKKDKKSSSKKSKKKKSKKSKRTGDS